MFSIAAVERATGLSKDVLRAWERRYGFPMPSRDEHGHRGYDESQLRRLQLIRQLLDLGLRPHEAVTLDEPQLKERLASVADRAQRSLPAAPINSDFDATWQAVLQVLIRRHVGGLHALLRRKLSSLGLPQFVQQVAAPLTRRVGQAWAAAEIGVDQEHLYTEVMTTLLASATLEWPVDDDEHAPRILFTTVPGESHGLGLRMAQAICAAEGSATICLGLQTPLTQTVEAVLRFRAHVLALSFSVSSPAALITNSLTELRRVLPSDVMIWAGGQAAGLRRLPALSPASWLIATSLDEVAPAVRQLRVRIQARSTQAPT